MLSSPHKCKYGDHPATKSLVWANGNAFIPVCDAHEARARARVKAQHDEVDRVVKIEEAYVPRRFPKGTREGGEFAPRTGRVGHPISGLRRAVLHELVPELPRPPKQRRHVRRTVSLDGRLVDVPEARSFARTIGGHRFTSPAGSTLVYRDGKPYKGPGGKHQVAPQLSLPALRQPAIAVEVEAADHEQALRLAHQALETHQVGEPPAALGASGWPTDTALREAGFRETDFSDTTLGLRFSYVAPDGASLLAVTYSKDGSKVAKVDWTPRTAPAPGRLLDRPPHTWEEFTAELDSYARISAQAHGRFALLGKISTNPDWSDHMGEHYWDGSVDVASDVEADILAAAVARARTGGLTDVQKRRVYAATQAGVHEMLHAANAVSRTEYDQPGMVLEEGLTEELSRVEALKMLRRQGQDDVVQWVADHPTDPRVVGTYMAYRHAIDEVLDDAKIAPELREEMVARLKWADPPDRLPTLTRAVARAQNIPAAIAEQRVLDTLTRVGKPRQTMLGRGGDWDAVPLLAPNADPSGETVAHEIGGMAVNVGDQVTVNRRGFRNGEWMTWGDKGDVIGITDTPAGWMLDVRYAHGDADYGVFPRHVAAVEAPDRDRVSFGVSTAALKLANGDTVKPGDTVRYDGRADGGFSEARVVRIVRDSNPNGTENNADWVMEAVTSHRSMSPGQRVLLTPTRTGSQIELAGTADVPHRGGGRRRAITPLTLDRKARLHQHFDMPPGTQMAALPQIVAADQPRPSRLRQEVARLADPAAPRVAAPAAFERSDGRLEVDGATVHAAERSGLGHLPVQVDRAWRGRARDELAHDLDQFVKHDVACPNDEFCHARIDGTQEALAIVDAGGGQDEILERAVAFGPLKGGSDRNEGFQTAMRNAWMTLEAARDLPDEVYGQKRYVWPAMTPAANPEFGEREDLGMAKFNRLRGNKAMAEKWERAARAAHAAGARKEPPDWESLFAPDDSEKNSDQPVTEPLDVSKLEKYQTVHVILPDYATPVGIRKVGNGQIQFASTGQRVSKKQLAAALVVKGIGSGSQTSGLGSQTGWQQKVYGSGGSSASTAGSPPKDELLEEPIPFDPKTLKSRDRAIVRDPEGNEFIATWSTKEGEMYLDPKGGGLAKTPTPIGKLPELLYLGKAAAGWSGYVAPKPVWDDAHTVLTTKSAGGSNDAMFAEAEDGTKWLVKRYRGDENRIATELLANAIYRKMGVRVPEAGQLTYNGKAALGYPLLEGKRDRWKGENEELGQGFMVDALLANWDVVGLDQDNILWDPEGRPFRVDQGGTLMYRAQGQPKPFGPVPSEVWTMNSPDGGQAFGRMAINDLTKRRGASKIASTLKPQLVDELVDAAPFADEKMREQVRDALKARIAWMGGYAKGTVAEPRPLEGLGAAESLASQRAALVLAPEQEVAVSALSAGWTPVLNEYLRTGKPEVASKRQLEFLAREADLLTKKTRAPEQFFAYGLVHIPDGKDPEGMELRERGFLPLSLAPPAAGEGETVVRVLVAKGAPLLYLADEPDRVAASPDLVLGYGARLKLLPSDDPTRLQAVAR